MDVDACSFCDQPVAISAKHCPNCGQPHVLRDKYRIIGLLGRGGFGIVYEAVDLQLKRRYAIKVILSDSAAGQQQVLTEAEILAQHARRFPFMPEIYDIWHDGPRTTLVMEYVEGQTLGQVLGEGQPWPANDVAAFLRDILADLGKLHAVGIIHRDLKPDNIKRTPDGRYMLLDFGIAKQEGSTLAGAKAFSPAYASPEQMRGQPTDERSDLYSLGATAYHLLTGQAPVPSEYRRSANITLPIPSDIVAEKIPPALQTIILTMLKLDAADRPADAAAALTLLDAADPAAPPAAASVAAGDVIARTTVMLQETASRVAEIREAAGAIDQSWAGWRGARKRRSERRAGPAIGLLVALLALVVAGGVWWRLTRPALVDPDPPGPVVSAAQAIDPANASQMVEMASFGRGSIQMIAFDPNGTTLAVATTLGVELWDSKTWQRTSMLTGFVRPVRSIAWSSANILAAVNGSEMTLWGADGQRRAVLPGNSGSSLDFATWSPDGSRLVAVDYATLLLWDSAGDLLARSEAHDFDIRQVAWSPDSQFFASGSFDETVRIWDRDGEPVTTLDLKSADPDRQNWIESLAWSPDNTRLAIGTYRGEIRLWQQSDGTLSGLPDGHTEAVIALAWSPDSATLVSGGRDSTIRLWREGALFKTIADLAVVTMLRWDRGDEGFVSGGSDGFLRLWSADGDDVQAYESRSGEIRGMAQSPDGQLLAAFTESELVHVWKRDAAQTALLEGYTSALQGLSASPDGAAVAIDSWAWDVAVWQPFEPRIILLNGHSNAVVAVAWSPDGATVAASAQDQFIRLWKTDGQLIKTIEAKGLTLALAWNGPNTLAGGGSDGVVRLWDADGVLIKELSNGPSPVRALAWSPDGARLAVGAEDGSVVVWEVPSGEKRVLKGHTEQITALAWNPDGTALVSGSWDDTALLWDESGASLTLAGESTGDVAAVAWSPDGARIAVGTSNGELRLWNGSGGLITVINQDFGALAAASWNSHGVLATATNGGAISLLNADGKPLVTLSGHTAGVNAIVWAADDTRLFSGSEDGTVRLWGIGAGK